ncbi:MAG: NUDIX hydrolase [Candidatus Aenigmarchaeota archaeon]|nr:NUDIX hydrolase [Candidatus Aenigmarchaeota archaeon]
MNKKIFVTADPVIIRNGKVILVKRRFPPYKGKWALPGGRVEEESVEKTCTREAGEETGLIVKPEKIIGIYSKPGRDPRGHTVTVAFRCRVTGGKLRNSRESFEIGDFTKHEVKKLSIAFDHMQILKDAGFL